LKENCEIKLENVAMLSKELSKFELYKLEKLQIINLLPSDEAELLLVSYTVLFENNGILGFRRP